MKSSYQIPLVKDTISDQELKKLAGWLETNTQLTKGPLVTKFEKAWAKWNGSQFAVFVNSGSSANLLMLYALVLTGKLKNDRAIVPAVSWVTTVAPFMQLAMDPILCDCDPDNLGLNIDHFRQLCQEYRPSVAILVHVLGHPNHMDDIREICREYEVLLLEDCCESHGSEFNGQKVGKFGLMGSFSFYYGHHMSTIEGGMVVTDDEELYTIMLSIRSHGWSRDLPSKHSQGLKIKFNIDDFRNRYTFYYPGFNLRPTELNAFLGLGQLKKLNSTVRKREKVYESFKENLSPYYWIQTSKGSPVSSFAIGLIDDDLPNIVDLLEENSVETRPLICGSIGEQPFWEVRYGRQVLTNATRVHNQGLYFPGNQDMTKQDIEKISSLLIRHRRGTRPQSLHNLSIVVCTKNSAAYLHKNLDQISVASPEAELLVVDADSSDETQKIARKFTRRVYSDRQKGLSFARQLGIDNTSRDFVAFVGADDHISRKTLIHMLNKFRDDPQIVGVQAFTVLLKPRSYWEKTTQQIFELLLNREGYTDVIGTPCIFRTQVVRKIRYDPQIKGGTDDTDIGLRLTQAGYKLYKISTPSYEQQLMQMSEFINRWQFYGKGDAEFYRKYSPNWTNLRKIQSITHPLRKYIIFGTAEFISAGKLQLIPGLWTAALARYYGWLRRTISFKK
ncbi:MAG: hypothetical protein COU69_04440 [Candidatus Pacebacteria bacterium CG10_big_fil_rev_8_21_14_0_10_56_10]|nr:MAG: hypothetical protein COU69_04440 [Candidatus Pacebacteria bacterium CG10_big_fil_rev_8_21_14_0_10_56_10]